MIFLYFLLMPLLVSAQTDTTEVIDSSVVAQPVVVDTLIIFSSHPLSETSNFIASETILFSDHRYAADFFSTFPFSFQRSFGSYGQPNELLIYGNGFGNTSVLRNGFDLTNAATNTYDYNFIQSEDVDSIEVIRAPRAFLYGFNTNNSAVNFISKDIVSNHPYTRIKYYEGNYGEAMIDARAGIFLMKRLNFNLDITNRKQEDSYKRSSFSHWMGKVNLKYYASSLFNVYSEYYYSKKTTDLNGGVDIDSIQSFSSDVNKIMYDYLQAPVKYLERYQKEFKNNFQIGSLFQLKNFRSEINVSSNSENREYRLNEKDTSFSQIIDQNYSSLNFNFHSNYQIVPEKIFTDVYLQTMKYKAENIFSTAKDGLLSKQDESKTISNFVISMTGEFLEKSFTPSIFYKYQNFDKQSKNGLGVDLTYSASNNISFYLGLSNYELSNDARVKPNNKALAKSYETEFQLGIDQIKFSSGIYYRSYENTLFQFYIWGWEIPPSVRLTPNELRKEIGLNTKLLFPIWKIWFEGFITYETKTYSAELATSANQYDLTPDLYSTMKIFYRDSLFDNNLELQTGFTIKYFRLNGLMTFDNYFMRSYLNKPEARDEFQIDFTASGRIQKTAIVYFAWENLLDREYFIYSYYPMQRRGIRFGLAWEFLN